jgi:cobalamin-dependent methionine synthase I
MCTLTKVAIESFTLLTICGNKLKIFKVNNCLSDFVAPKSSGKVGYLGAFAVTAGTWGKWLS